MKTLILVYAARIELTQHLSFHITVERFSLLCYIDFELFYATSPSLRDIGSIVVDPLTWGEEYTFYFLWGFWLEKLWIRLGAPKRNRK